MSVLTEQYQQNLLQSMQVVANSAVQGISYDKTVLCKIEDITQRDQGKYVVSENTVKFTAYSTETKYAKNTMVYVVIPNGDYSMQKIIIGKQIKNTDEPYVFVNPFDTIVDLTKNIIDSTNRGGLIANYPETPSKVIFEDYSLNKGQGYPSFQRFGLQADFFSDVPQTVQGHYGLRITLHDKQETSVSGEWKNGTHVMLLDSAEMIGNPYDFESYYRQEKVFDISELGIITGIKVEFYQMPGTFITKDGKSTPYQDDYGQLFWPNLKVQNIYCCLGYDLGSIGEELIELYTFDNRTYDRFYDNSTNRKKMYVRWVHIDDNGTPTEINEYSNKDIGNPLDINEDEKDEDYEVRWYKYKLGAPSADEYSGVYWERVPIQESVNLAELFPIDPDDPTQRSSSFNLFEHPNYYLKYVQNYTNIDNRNLNRSNSVGYFNRLTANNWIKLFESDFINDGRVWFRFGFWEKFALAYLFYWRMPEAFNYLGMAKFWSHGSDYRLKGSVDEGKYNQDKANLSLQYSQDLISYDTYIDRLNELNKNSINPWFEKYIDKNPYKELTYDGTNHFTYVSSLSNNDLYTKKMQELLISFTDTFGPWVYEEDVVSGLGDYVPADPAVQEELYEQMRRLYYAIDNPITDIKKCFEYSFIPDTSLQTEQFKVIIIYKNIAYRSNILTFKNNELVPNRSTLDSMNALGIICIDEVYDDATYYSTYGNYLIYDENNTILDKADASKVRNFAAIFDLDGYEDTDISILTEASRITWGIPAHNSMIVIEGFDYENYPTSPMPTTEGGVMKYDAANDLILITRQCASQDLAIKFDNSINAYQPYTIRSYYSPGYSNNTIQCEIEKDNRIYRSQKELTFGQAGTTGTDCTLVLDFDNNKTCLTEGSGDVAIITARLYDANNLEQDISNLAITWSWFKTPDTDGYQRATNYQSGTNYYRFNAETGVFELAGGANSSNINNYYKKVSKSNHIISEGYSKDGKTYSTKRQLKAQNLCISDSYIIQCRVDGWGDYPLIAYLPIPVKRNISGANNPAYITGATQIIYNSEGKAQYYKQPYYLHRYETIKLDNGKIISTADTVDWLKTSRSQLRWAINYINLLNDEKLKVYLPTIKEDTSNKYQFKLSPVDLFIDDLPVVSAVCYDSNNIILWNQPILIIQNQYPSAMINQWDGKSLTLDYETGSILSTRIAAGKKDSLNRFSGVMLGDWQSKSNSSITQTGIYGFHEGAMSYAFKEDGTAFIGKSTTGRIDFDGNNGTITSASYNASKVGMKLDLDDGYIDILGFSKKWDSDANKYIYSSTNNQIQIRGDGNPYFKIHGNYGGYSEDLIYIGNGSYFLQSLDFSNSSRTGVKLDLQQGRLTGYEFVLNAGSTMTDGVEYETTPGGSLSIDSRRSEGSIPLRIVGDYTQYDEEGNVIGQGGKFQVNWDGSLHATAGYIGGWIIGKNFLKNKENTIVLKTSAETDKGESKGEHGLLLRDHHLVIGKSFKPSDQYGWIGYLQSNTGNIPKDLASEGIGMVYSKDTKAGVVKVTNENVGMRWGTAEGSGYIHTGQTNMIAHHEHKTEIRQGAIREGASNSFIILSNKEETAGKQNTTAHHLTILNVPAQNQHGIYARFA